MAKVSGIEKEVNTDLRCPWNGTIVHIYVIIRISWTFKFLWTNLSSTLTFLNLLFNTDPWETLLLWCVICSGGKPVSFVAYISFCDADICLSDKRCRLFITTFASNLYLLDPKCMNRYSPILLGLQYNILFKCHASWPSLESYHIDSVTDLK